MGAPACCGCVECVVGVLLVLCGEGIGVPYCGVVALCAGVCQVKGGLVLL